MKYVFTGTGKRVIESLSFAQTLYAFDFDGTLAPIVSTPSAARMPNSTNILLKELSVLAPVAIVSGRSVADLKKRLDFTPKFLIGNHGLEGILSNGSFDQAKKLTEKWVKHLESKWNFDTGTFIENKSYSLALHYRKSRNKKTSRLKLIELVKQLEPAPRIVPGKCVINLIPPGAPHKGVALQELLKASKLKCALYAGDDDTDEDVFSLPDDRIISVRIGQRRNSQAQYYLKRQSEMNRLIREILKQVHQCRKM